MITEIPRDMDFVARALEQAVRTIKDFPVPGIQFKDITPILSDPVLLSQAVGSLAAPFLEAGVTKVIGIEARGFIFGAMLAERLEAGFIPVRKKGKLPYETLREQYALEYGTDDIEMHIDAVHPTDRVLIHDDVIATGGTARAAFRLVEQVGATVVGYAFLVELQALHGRELLDAGSTIHSVMYL
jgi:adenine phosphoribosyltransferase